MNITFDKAKNGDITAVYNNINLHSSYNPSREAERFVNNLIIPYTPPLIIIIEPCISYIVPLMKTKYPNSKIALIRFDTSFSEYNKTADYVLNYFEHTLDFSNYLYNTFGEELLFTAYFVQWEPSAKAFYKLNQSVIKSITETLEKSKTLLVTREYFEKKWFLNSVNFIRYSNNLVKLTEIISCPVLIVSSGPSLTRCLDIIKINQNKMFIICLSSAISVLLRNNIIPDLCITTDGGFWAGQHLKRLSKYNIPIAVPLEGYIQKEILNTKQILPLGYNDGLSNELCRIMNFPTTHAERNGTVSGTALIFALDNSSNDIYFAGLDMSNQRGYQHTQPNENELNNSINDYKINSKEKRISRSEYSNGVMNIYKEWFDSLDLKNRDVYRIIDTQYKHNTLGYIQDISSDKFSNKVLSFTNSKENKYISPISFKYDNSLLTNIITKNLNTPSWMKKLYPLSYTALTHNENNTDILNRLNKENTKLLQKIGKILDD